MPWIELPEKEKDLVLVSENEAFNVGMLTGEIMVSHKGAGPGVTDLGFIHKEDVSEAIGTDGSFDTELRGKGS